MPTNRLGITDLVLYGGDAPSVLDDPLLERRAGVADRLYDLAAPRPEDLFVIISNSGVNKVIVEMALRVKERGHRLLAITSLAHTRAVPAGHLSGKKLADLADVVLDNAAPRGDALLELPTGGAVCALSTLTGAMLVQLSVAEAAARLIASGSGPRLCLGQRARRVRGQSGAGEAVRGANSPYRELTWTCGRAAGAPEPGRGRSPSPRAPVTLAVNERKSDGN